MACLGSCTRITGPTFGKTGQLKLTPSFLFWKVNRSFVEYDWIATWALNSTIAPSDPIDNIGRLSCGAIWVNNSWWKLVIVDTLSDPSFAINAIITRGKFGI